MIIFFEHNEGVKEEEETQMWFCENIVWEMKLSETEKTWECSDHLFGG